MSTYVSTLLITHKEQNTELVKKFLHAMSISRRLNLQHIKRLIVYAYKLRHVIELVVAANLGVSNNMIAT